MEKKSEKSKGLEIFLAEASKRGAICEKYEGLLESASSAKDYFDAACSVQGIEMVCGSVRDGWFMDSGSVFSVFGRMINGKYRHSGLAYTSSLYYGYRGAALMDVTCVCVIDSAMTVVVPERRRAVLYACGFTSLRVTGKGSAKVFAYGDVRVDGDSSLKSFEKIER